MTSTSKGDYASSNRLVAQFEIPEMTGTEENAATGKN